MHVSQAEDRVAWDERIAAAGHSHLLRSPGWGELKARFGWRVNRLSLEPPTAQGCTLDSPFGRGTGVSCAQVSFRYPAGGLGTFAYALYCGSADNAPDAKIG